MGRKITSDFDAANWPAASGFRHTASYRSDNTNSNVLPARPPPSRNRYASAPPARSTSSLAGTHAPPSTAQATRASPRPPVAPSSPGAVTLTATLCGRVPGCGAATTRSASESAAIGSHVEPRAECVAWHHCQRHRCAADRPRPATVSAVLEQACNATCAAGRCGRGCAAEVELLQVGSAADDVAEEACPAKRHVAHDHRNHLCAHRQGRGG
eukprot:365455-Chlamydomonas_euryale.AAC.18